MLRRVAILLMVFAFAAVTMGQDGCDTETGDGERSERQKERAQERQRQQRQERREKQREQEQEKQTAPPIEDPEPASDCAPGYDPCVPSYPPDLDCPDVGGPVSVSGSDPHGLDADGDGMGCET